MGKYCCVGDVCIHASSWPERENIVKPDETAKEVLPYDILLLDDIDSEFKGKGEYDDRLYLLDQLLNIGVNHDGGDNHG